MIWNAIAAVLLAAGCAVCVAVVAWHEGTTWGKARIVLFIAIVFIWPLAAVVFGIYYPPADCPLGLPDRNC